MKCFEQSKKLYWDIETKEEYDEVKKWSKNELLAAISDYVSDNADCEIYNIMYEYFKRLNVKSKNFPNPCNVQELNEFWSSGYLHETNDKFMLEYPSNKKISIDELRRKQGVTKK